MLPEILTQPDISTLSSDFQPEGTATPGSTGRVADAGHVHPSGPGTPVGYQIITLDVVSDTSFNGPGTGYYADNSSGEFNGSGNSQITIDAPAGYILIQGGYNGIAPGVNGDYRGDGVEVSGYPAMDGSSWTVSMSQPYGWGLSPTNDTVIGNLWGICIQVS